MKLQNKTAIVTGASNGIGLGIAKLLLEEGASVVFSDIADGGEKVIEGLGENAHYEKCDVSLKSDVENLVLKTVERFGGVDILVNNAGIYPYVPFETMTEADWDKVMNVNLKGIYLMTNTVLRVMKEGGKIVNISSIASFKGFENLVHYCASKGGVNSFTNALALEVAPKKINVNAVAPGAIETKGAAMSDEQKNAIIPLIPMGRIGTPDDIAEAVVFLSSDAANYITGQVLTVDGGWTCR